MLHALTGLRRMLNTCNLKPASPSSHPALGMLIGCSTKFGPIHKVHALGSQQAIAMFTAHTPEHASPMLALSPLWISTTYSSKSYQVWNFNKKRSRVSIINSDITYWGLAERLIKKIGLELEIICYSILFCSSSTTSVRVTHGSLNKDHQIFFIIDGGQSN